MKNLVFAGCIFLLLRGEGTMEYSKVEHYETLTDFLRAQGATITRPIALFLEKLGLHPNTITILALLLSIGVAVVLSNGYLTLGGIALLLVSSLDALDGALARVSGAKSRFGAFLDSTFDRFSEGSLLFGLAVWLLSQGRSFDVSLVFLTLLASIMVSYTRARAEGLGYTCKVGWLTRVERVLILGAGLIVGWVRPMLLLMTLLTWITVGQRVLYVYKESLRNP